MPADRKPGNPSPQGGRKTESRIEAAIAFARTLHRILSSSPADAPATDSLVGETKKNIDRLHTPMKHAPGISGNPEIDSLGTELWNISTRLRRENTAPPREDNDQGRRRLGRLFLHGRVLAFHILTVARAKTAERGGRVGDVVYLMKLALKSAKDCVDDKEPGLALPVLQKADYKGRLQDISPRLGKEDVGEMNCLEVEYYIIRTALSWMEDRLDVAEHMYTKAERLDELLTPNYAERLADVLFEIGKSLSSRSDFLTAIKWLERANDIINSQDLEDFSCEGVELRLGIVQALVTALLDTGTADGLDRARIYVDCIGAEVGRNVAVSLLRLELLQKTPTEVFDSVAYGDILRQVIKEFNPSESGFKLIIYHIRKLHDKSPGTGCTVLDESIIALTKSERDAWMERAVIIRTWMITNQRDTLDTIDACR